MYKTKRIIIYFIAIALLSSLFVGCSKKVDSQAAAKAPDNKIQTKSEDKGAETKAEHSTNATSSDKLEAWAGDYVFDESAPPDENRFSRISIYKEQDGYYAKIINDGFQIIERVQAKISGDENSIKLVFDKYLPDNLYEPYKQGDVLLSLEKKDSKIYTTWGKMQAMLPDHLKPGQVYFVKK